MADAPKILGTDTLRDAYPKLNSAIDNSNEAKTKADTAIETANTAKTTADTVQSQFDQVVAEAGENNPEVVQARGEAVNLNARLNATDAQLAEKASLEEARLKADKLQLEDMDAETLAAIEGGEGTSFNLLSIPQDQSVSLEKLTTEFKNDYTDFGNFKLSNLIKNGDFNNALTDWNNTNGVVAENGKAKISIANGISLQQPVSFVVGHKYYVSLLHRAESVERNLDLTLRNGSTLITPALLSMPVGSIGGTTSETRFSKLFTVNEAATSLGFLRNGTSVGGFHYVDNIQLFDLTDMYGAGNEPTKKEDIEKLIDLYNGYISGTKRLGNKEFSFHLFDEIKKSESIASRSVYEELRGNVHQRNYRVDKKFKAGEAIVSSGDVTLLDVADPKYQRYNNTSMKVTVNSPTNFRIDFPFSTPIDLYRKEYALNFYMPPESQKTPRQSKFSVLAIYLTTLNGAYIIYPENDRRYPGWNSLIGNPFNRNSASAANEVDLTNVTNIRLHLNVDPTITEPYDIYFDSFVSWDYVNNPTVRLEFDDAIHTVYDNAFPLMAERGMRGATHVITKNIITEDPIEYITNEGLKRMHDVGWDICSHSRNHLYISTLTEQEQLYELEQSQKDLLGLGLRNGPQFYIAPYGDNTLYATEQARKFYANYRMTGYRPGISVMPQLPYAMECIDAGVRGLSGVTTLIDKAVETGGHLPLMWHGEIGETWGGIMWQTGEFKDMLDYLIEKGVKVVTYSDQFPNSQVR
jgi:peptidoglycan/xylan/chitin deacetylase (PgdA/CDA1 family)